MLTPQERPSTIQEAVLRQVQNLRTCFNERKNDAEAAVNALNELERAKQIAGSHLLNGCDENGEEFILTNDKMRDAYVKNKTIEQITAYNTAKTNADISDARIEVERSVLSALKDLVGDSQLDFSHLGKYDI